MAYFVVLLLVLMLGFLIAGSYRWWSEHAELLEYRRQPVVVRPTPTLPEVDRLIRALIEAIPRPVLVTTADRVILDANRAALDLVGGTWDNVKGRVLATVIQNYETTRMLMDAATSGVAQEHTISRMLNGETWHVTVKPLSLKSDANSISHLLLFIDDETRLRYLETVRRDFVASVSHELRTPLASVKLLAETLDEAVVADPATARMMAERITREVDHLTSLVDDLLDLSRIESGRIHLELEPTDLGGVMEVATDRMRPLAEERGIQINVQISDTFPPAQADGERIGQVFVNLIHNAIKFTPAGGTITLSAKVATLRQVQQWVAQSRTTSSVPGPVAGDTPVIVVQVTDTGIGIVEEDLPRIFERFFKAKDLQMRGPAQRDAIARPGHHGGTGLGLAIARHIIEAQNGQIWAESTLGRGSTFAFSLPLASQDALTPASSLATTRG